MFYELSEFVCLVFIGGVCKVAIADYVLLFNWVVRFVVWLFNLI